MNQEKIGNLIKKIRKENKLTQQEFASKYNVTYQAVSKWENGKNIPDIALLKQICNDYNLNVNDFLDGSIKKKRRYSYIIILSVIILSLILLGIYFLFKKNSDNIILDGITSSCEDFSLTGTIAYNESKASIKIENVSYCGNDFNKVYDYIECTLYETNNNSINKIDTVSTNQKTTLNDFLNMVKFNINSYDKICKEYKNGNLYIEVNLIDKSDTKITHKIPLKLDSCSKNE